MNKFMKIAAVVTFGLMATACGRIEAGHKGIKVDLLGSDKGVNSEEVGPGRYFLGVNTELYAFPTFTQNYVWTKDNRQGSDNDESLTFQTVEGMSVGADIGISYAIDGSRVSEIFQKYRTEIEDKTEIAEDNSI